MRICATCGAPVALDPRGYTHVNAPDRHTPIPVRRVDAREQRFGHVSHGTKRSSGAAALFTQGDGKRFTMTPERSEAGT